MRNQVQIKILLWVSILLLALSACKFQETESRALPIEISPTGTQDVDVDFIVRQVQDLVQDTLPNSYLVALGFAGRCRDLPGLRGEIVLDFVQVKTFLFHRQVLAAFTSVDTVQGTLEVWTKDVSDYYWSTDLLLPQDVSVAREVSQMAYRHITDLGILDCDVVMDCVGNQRDIWHILCTEPESGPGGRRLCEFEINAKTRQILDTSQ
jgi:hypothetical protein